VEIGTNAPTDDTDADSATAAATAATAERMLVAAAVGLMMVTVG